MLLFQILEENCVAFELLLKSNKFVVGARYQSHMFNKITEVLVLVKFMSKDEVKGKLKKEEGKIRVGAGRVTGNVGQIIKGEAEKAKGKIQEDVGKAKRKL